MITLKRDISITTPPTKAQESLQKRERKEPKAVGRWAQGKNTLQTQQGSHIYELTAVAWTSTAQAQARPNLRTKTGRQTWSPAPVEVLLANDNWWERDVGFVEEHFPC